jgi:predicted metal-dependent phosphoesterase TrpH
MIKVELHAHTDDDPSDYIPYSARRLIERAAALGYGALAITLHDRYTDPAPLASYARDHGITLLSGIERTVAGRHLLLINFPPAAGDVRSFEDVRQLKMRTQGLVVVPHPYFPLGHSLGPSLLEAHASLIDAVEVNAMYARGLDFNRRAIAWAAAHGKPVVGNSDLHRLSQLGTTWSMVDSEPEPDAICEAIRAGRVTLHTRRLSWFRAGVTTVQIVTGGWRGRYLRRKK